MPLEYVVPPLSRSVESTLFLLKNGGSGLPLCWLHSAAPGKKEKMALQSSIAKLVDISFAFCMPLVPVGPFAYGCV